MKMALAMKLGVEAGRLSYEAGRMTKKLYASASSPLSGVIGRNGRAGHARPPTGGASTHV